MTKTNERSRYISTELGIRERLVSAIITNEDTVHSMAVSVNKTLSHHLQKLLFFFGTQERAISRHRICHLGGKIAFFEFLLQKHFLFFFSPRGVTFGVKIWKMPFYPEIGQRSFTLPPFASVLKPRRALKSKIIVYYFNRVRVNSPFQDNPFKGTPQPIGMNIVVHPEVEKVKVLYQSLYYLYQHYQAISSKSNVIIICHQI